jgi:hypothetical protein
VLNNDIVSASSTLLPGALKGQGQEIPEAFFDAGCFIEWYYLFHARYIFVFNMETKTLRNSNKNYQYLFWFKFFFIILPRGPKLDLCYSEIY